MESGSVMAMPAIMAGTRCELEATMSANAALGALFGAADDARGLALLRTVPAEMLVGLTPLVPDFNLTPAFPQWPVFDGRVLPRDVWQSLAAGEHAKVPLLIGYNGDEGSVFVPYSTEAFYAAAVLRMFGYGVGREVLARYPVDAQHDALSRMRDLVTYGMFQAGMKRIMDAFSREGIPVYAYRFTHVGERDRKAGLGAAHMREIPFFFGNAAPQEGAAIAGDMRTMYASFIRTGDPNAGRRTGIAWQRYDPAGKAMLRFGDGVEAEVMANADDLEFFDGALERAYRGGFGADAPER
jgi:para-nitrobenzyl esterase